MDQTQRAIPRQTVMRSLVHHADTRRFYDDHGWTFIFYTGKKPLVITDRSVLGPMVMIFKV